MAPNNGAIYNWSPGGDIFTASVPGNGACMALAGLFGGLGAGHHISTGIV